MADSNRMGLLAELMRLSQPGMQQPGSPFYQQERPYQSINDAGLAMGRDGGLLALQRLFGIEMTPNQRVGAAFYDALPMEHWGRKPSR